MPVMGLVVKVVPDRILIGTEVEEGGLRVQPLNIQGPLTWPLNLKGFIRGHGNAAVADS